MPRHSTLARPEPEPTVRPDPCSLPCNARRRRRWLSLGGSAQFSRRRRRASRRGGKSRAFFGELGARWSVGVAAPQFQAVGDPGKGWFPVQRPENGVSSIKTVPRWRALTMTPLASLPISPPLQISRPMVRAEPRRRAAFWTSLCRSTRCWAMTAPVSPAAKTATSPAIPVPAIRRVMRRFRKPCPR